MTASAAVLLNGDVCPLNAPAAMTTLAWLREQRGLVGTKEGCGEGECGACTVLLGDGARYRAVAACLLPVGELAGRHLVTIEGLDPPADLNPIQRRLVDEGAPQCGFCFPGIVVSLTGFFLSSPALDYEDAVDAIDGNICRCTGYASIRRALAAMCREFAPRLDPAADRVTQLVAWGILPASFLDVATLLRTLADGATATSGALLVGGATDLLVQQPPALEASALSFVSRRTDLQSVTREDGHVVIGGGVTVEELRHAEPMRELVPGIDEIVALFASTIIRGRATVAGNLVNASPIGDVTVLMLCLGAELRLVGEGGERTVPLAAFYRGYKTLDLRPGEIVASVRVPVASEHDRVSFEKVSQRRRLDIAAVNSALRARVENGVLRDVRLAVGGVAPVPLLAAATAAALEGRVPDAATARQAAGCLDGEIAPISDVRGSSAYKRVLARRLLWAHLLKLVPDCVTLEELV